ncbi:uncharacterized protein M421DRAFT_2000 [Didymella exigua CBS 183.55]|uniref:Uncharacterized protein n=1 Tax=Didymella exigua CBS 183.55 TaxID=1150837 RepID=A0A6A5RYQ6_9PLEO|nr:uncharacterized protein M421DRAFT_2000 [Didymella exigua CBS 183.55]KAF1932364.1 hypothetical protein M421DRAFT_2000 [Didymella exigua CBS 183.55]
MQAFQMTGWCSHVTDDSPDKYSTTSAQYLPQHRQFVKMMYDIHAYTERQEHLEEVEVLTRDAASPELLEELSRLNI